MEGKAILAAYGVPVAPTRLAGSPQEAAALAAEIDGPVALKIVSPDILHKSDVGGVALDLAGPAMLRRLQPPCSSASAGPRQRRS